jgi:alpha-ketoglutarate-dependent taurine dioxygenase
MRGSELETNGWLRVSGISSHKDLLDLGREIGCPVRSPNGELIKEIVITPTAAAKPGTQSAIYGTGPFPLHTDTVFWPLPVRYIILRAHGDVRRPTTLMTFANVSRMWGRQTHALAERSVWLAGVKTRRFYCSLRFRNASCIGWRYDADLMTPMNNAAAEVHRILQSAVFDENLDRINWSGNEAVILSNWTVMHGRGPEPPKEGVRVIERLYVR